MGEYLNTYSGVVQLYENAPAASSGGWLVLRQKVERVEERSDLIYFVRATVQNRNYGFPNPRRHTQGHEIFVKLRAPS